MAKGTSFAAKAKGKKKNTQSFVKYVKSVKSEKTGSWRFNEQMIGINEGENLDGALKRLDVESMALDMELPAMDEIVAVEIPSEADAPKAGTPDETPTDEKSEVTSEENKTKEAPAEEAAEIEQLEDSKEENAVEEIPEPNSSEDKEEEKTDEDSSEEKTEIDQDGNSAESDTDESKNEIVEEKTKE